MNTNQHECPEAANRKRPATDRQGITHKVTLFEPSHQSTHGAGQAAGAPEASAFAGPTADMSPRCSADGGAVDFYITLNRYPDGRPCEVFAKATNGYQGWCDAVCRLVSLLLQHGVELQAICRQLAFAHFAPCGRVPSLEPGGRSWFARSFVDYLARWLESQVGGGPATAGYEETSHE